MSKNAPRLGRGLDSLIGTAVASTPPQQGEPAYGEAEAGPPVRFVPIGLLEPNPFQPRKDLDETGLAELAESIKQDGLLQPIAVRQAGAKYQIVIGERRWRAAKMAGLHEVPATVRQIADEDMLALALVENIHREDLNAIEKAHAYERLRQTLAVSIEQLAQRLGQDRSTVSNYLRLLELEEPIQAMLRAGQLTMGHARALLGAQAECRMRLARQVVEQGLSVRALERAVQRSKESPARPAEPEKRPHIRLLEDRFAEALGVRTVIREGKRQGRGRIVLYYRTLDDFDRICRLLNIDLAEV